MSDQTPPTPPPVNRGSLKPLKQCADLGEAFGSGEFLDRIKQGLPSHLNPNAMLRTYIQAVQKTPLIMKVPVRQAIGAFLTLNQLGLMPNNPLGEAFLIPFARSKWNPASRQREIQGYDLNVVIGYKGYLNIAFRSGLVGAIHSDVVYESDDFDYVYGTKQFLEHRPTGKQPDGATPGYVYAVAHLTGTAAGELPFRVLPWTEVLRARNGSQAYQTAVRAKETAEEKGWRLPATFTEAPWVKHVIPMAMKTAFLRLSTWIPRSLELAGAQTLDEAGERGARIDFSGALDGGNVIDQTIDFQEEDPDAGSGFGMRVPDGEQPQDTPKQPEPPQEQPPPQSTQPPAPTFSQYLCTDLGELAEANGGHFRDPVAWVEAYLAEHRTSRDHDTLAENNDEALADIRANHPSAAAGLPAEPQTAAAGAADPHSAPPGAAITDPVTIPMPMKGSRMDLTGYIAIVRTALNAMDRAQLDAWIPLNTAGPVFANMPSSTRKALLAAIERRMGILSPQTETPPAAQDATPATQDAPPAAPAAEPEPPQPQPAAAAPAPQETAPPPPADDEAAPSATTAPADPARASDIEWITATIGDIKRVTTRYALASLANNPAVVARRRMIGERNPDLLAQLKTAGDARYAELPEVP